MHIYRPIASAYRLMLALVVAAMAMVAVPTVAAAEGPPPGGLIALEVKSVDPGARTVTGVQHCVSPELAGKVATFSIAPNVDLAPFQPRTIVGVQLEGGVIVRTDGPPCNVQPPAPGGNQQPNPPGGGPNQGGPNRGGDGKGEGEKLDGGFLSRVWKFVGEVDGYEAGKLSITVGKVLNLPKKYRDQDDEIVDEDALVLVSSARVYDKDNKKAAKADLADAESVRVQGKILPEAKWQKDEDGTPVVTIRAKKIYITG